MNPSIPRSGIGCAPSPLATAVESGETRILTQVEAAEQPVLERLLDERPPAAFDPSRAAQPRHSRKTS